MKLNNKETICKLYDMYMDEIYENTVENIEQSEEIAELEELLNNILTEEQKKVLNELQEHQYEFDKERNELINKNTFVFAFSLAIKLFTEALNGKKE